MHHCGHYTPPRKDIAEAICAAFDYAPCGICFEVGKGWSAYDLKLGCSGEPEFILLKKATLPYPLTDTAAEVLDSLIRSKLR